MQAGLDDVVALRELAGSFAGQLVHPDDPDYHRRRAGWNGAVDGRPRLIARCTGVSDVRSALRFAGRTGYRVGGPGLGSGDPEVVLDLGLMRGIRVDPGERNVRVQAGVRVGALDRETQEFGLAVPSGVLTRTGIAGLALGGGTGWLTRRYGLTVDQLLSVDLVTPDGEFLAASPTEDAGLFESVQDGAGAGVVTGFEFRLNPVGPMVLAGTVYWPATESARLLRFYREWISEVPDELTSMVVRLVVPARTDIPAELHGQPVVAVVCCYCGPIEDGERILRPLRRFGVPRLDRCVPMRFLDHQAMLDPYLPSGRWYQVRYTGVGELSDEVIDLVAGGTAVSRSPYSLLVISHLGGAGPAAGHTLSIVGATETADGYDTELAWVDRLWSGLAPYSSGGYGRLLPGSPDGRG